jgi:acetyl-CoA carboxylase carboxyl transferase subunit beta
MLHHREVKEQAHVCTYCGHHMRIEPAERFRLLFDDSSFETIALPEVPSDPLRFRDEKRYTDRLKEARQRTRQADAVQVAAGAIGGHKAVIAAQNFAFMGGSLGMASGEAIVHGAEAAVARRAAYVVVSAAGGARMQEGILSLMQMPRTIAAVQGVRAAGLPYVSILSDPTTGGVTASYAMLGDIAIAEPGALIGFAGPRVIEQTIRERLPEGFQRSEYLLEHGMLDLVVPRAKLRETLALVLDHLMAPGRGRALTPVAAAEPDIPTARS